MLLYLISNHFGIKGTPRLRDAFAFALRLLRLSVREQVKSGFLQTARVSSQQQLADLLIEPL